MGNRDVSAALEYHNATKHSYWSVRSGHGLDWPNQPLPFKIYKDVDSVRLLTDGSPITANVTETVGAEPLAHDTESIPGLGLACQTPLSLGGDHEEKALRRRGIVFPGCGVHRGPLSHRPVPRMWGPSGPRGGGVPLRAERFRAGAAERGRLPGRAGRSLGARGVHSGSAGYACACGHALAERLEVRCAGVQTRILGRGNFACQHSGCDVGGPRCLRR